MQLRLDPRVPTVWRDPFSLQFGVDPARVILRDVSLADERLIAALAAGVTRDGLTMVGRAAGVDARAVDRLLDSLRPVLAEPAIPPAPHRVSLVGTGPTLELLAATLRESGLTVTQSPAVHQSDAVGQNTPAARSAAADCDVGVAVGHYVLDPDLYGFWLRRDLPHLAIIYGDGIATVGPLVEPGVTACLYCLEHHRRDADGSRSAIASQLWGRRSAAETPLAVQEVAAIAARSVVRRLSAGREPTLGGAAGASVGLAVDTGEITRRQWMPHPDCGCVALPDTAPATAGLSESGSAGDLGPLMRSAVVRARG